LERNKRNKRNNEVNEHDPKHSSGQEVPSPTSERAPGPTDACLLVPPSIPWKECPRKAPGKWKGLKKSWGTVRLSAFKVVEWLHYQRIISAVSSRHHSTVQSPIHTIHICTQSNLAVTYKVSSDSFLLSGFQVRSSMGRRVGRSGG
jgi:hypothetical protein